jgi:hypothetical protein
LGKCSPGNGTLLWASRLINLESSARSLGIGAPGSAAFEKEAGLNIDFDEKR